VPRAEVHARHREQPEIDVLLPPQNRAGRFGDLFGLEARGRDLVEERLKEVVIVTIDENHVHGRAPQGPGDPQTAESSSNDDDGGDRSGS
jgi:hypothetical protein